MRWHAANEAAGEKSVGILGAGIARQCLEAGLLYEIVVYLAPVMLGDGVRLFEQAATDASRWSESVWLSPDSSQIFASACATTSPESRRGRQLLSTYP
jgi:dihydrofolate reductase